MSLLQTLSESSVRRHSQSLFSQNGEDGILAHVLHNLVSPDSIKKYAVEIGVAYDEEGKLEGNTVALRTAGWEGLYFDLKAGEGITVARVTASSLSRLLSQHNVPHDLGVLSIDVDGIDYWLWKALPNSYRPAVVVIEYNAHLAPKLPLTVPYDPQFPEWFGTSWFGASAEAMIRLAHTKGYKLVACVHHLNLFFVRDDLLHPDFKEEIDYSIFGPITRHPDYSRAVWISCESDMGRKAMIGGELGYSLEPDGTCELRYLLVDHEYRRRGVGTALIQQLIDTVPRTLYVFTRATDEYAPARGLYAKMGFQLVYLPRFYQGGTDGVFGYRPYRGPSMVIGQRVETKE